MSGIGEQTVPESEKEASKGPVSKKSWMGFLKTLATFTGDLSSLTAPSFILSGTSLLEYLSYWYEYPEIFVSIPDGKTPLERMMNVLKWYICGINREYASRNQSYGTEKKPLNPILGELLIGSWDSSKGKVDITVEQVSHHPPVSVCRAVCEEAGIEALNYNPYKCRFSGRTLAVSQPGQIRIHLKKYDETYYFNLPNLTLEGLWYMAPYIELHNSTHIVSTTGYITKINYHGRGYFSGTKNSFKANVYKKGEKADYVVEGVWTGESKIRHKGEHDGTTFLDLRQLKPTPVTVAPIEQQGEYETRRVWRDVARALAEGDYDAASSSKTRIEQEQRELRKRERAEHRPWKCRFFKWDADNSGLRTAFGQFLQEIVDRGTWVWTGDRLLNPTADDDQTECVRGDSSSSLYDTTFTSEAANVSRNGSVSTDTSARAAAVASDTLPSKPSSSFPSLSQPRPQILCMLLLPNNFHDDLLCMIHLILLRLVHISLSLVRGWYDG
ncbi:oxysterol binding protein [Schizosaccharomyces japonicus yFS275]|uniref:Oxysterol binding protein n=1 Tax=Schizosaccharomyces japonicus (strain yFS275 / FY16936) TaxID=402676 RepID=B6K258_SCHJY|nr:oxysterol binding protein [Schizosaccharomyces japonicus yFS275]EEB07239.2 oxysterol binding protein [Schizosaccharomyces japonicus yFS275]